jgi:hypothetical protein
LVGPFERKLAGHGNVDPRPDLEIEHGSGERTGIGRFRKVGQLAAGPAERFDPEGRNSPKGEWRPGKWQARLAVEAATGHQR